MNFSFRHLHAEMKIYALKQFPEEACGLIVNDKFIPCKNVHSAPLTNFAIDAKAYAKAEKKGTIQAVFHSHPGELNTFSMHDIKSCKQGGLPWVMYCTVTGEWFEIDPSGDAPYLGRRWQYGIYDCYSLFRDFYRREFNILLDDFDRGQEGEWTSPEWRMFEKHVEKQGFVDVEGPLHRGDMLLMQMQSSFINHAGFIAVPERNIFYQHLVDRLSEENVYGGYWAKVTNRIMRHKELL
jgi:proteasome lid subunit RPN8/RPN11